MAPLGQGSFFGRLSNLGRARQAGVVAFQPAEIQQAAGLANGIGNELLITQLMDRPRQAVVPVAGRVRRR